MVSVWLVSLTGFYMMATLPFHELIGFLDWFLYDGSFAVSWVNQQSILWWSLHYTWLIWAVIFIFEVCLMNKQTNEIINRRKKNPKGTNNKHKVNPSLKMPTTDPPLTPHWHLTSRYRNFQPPNWTSTLPTKGIFMLDSVF